MLRGSKGVKLGISEFNQCIGVLSKDDIWSFIRPCSYESPFNLLSVLSHGSFCLPTERCSNSKCDVLLINDMFPLFSARRMNISLSAFVKNGMTVVGPRIRGKINKA